MSHGGLGGGGSHGHGGHGAAAMGMHADQSPSWNMAMQAEKSEKDLSKRMSLFDPRVVIVISLIVFVTLITLPYTMDYMQSQGMGGGNSEPVPDSSGPSLAALSMVGTTMMGGHVELPESAMEKIAEAQGGHNRGRERMRELVSTDQSSQLNENSSVADQQSEAARSAAEYVHDAPELASKSANDTVAAMVEASGLNHGASRSAAASSQAAPSSFGAPMQAGAIQSVQAAPAVAIEYGGAMKSATQDYYVYIPGQAPAEAALPQTAALVRTRQQVAMAEPRVEQMAPQIPYDPSSPFNPSTSAMVAPMGLRNHAGAPTMPLVPSTRGQDGSTRFKVLVSK